jgi:tRNA nucleotidyltransferase/poly(A) polymerase
MRCVRFASRYGWDIEKETLKALHTNVDRLSIISAERITDEFDKIISNADVHKVFIGVHQLEEIRAFKYIFPNVELHTALILSPLLDNMYTRIATLLYNADNTKQLLIDRKYSNDIINRICEIIRLSKIYGDLSVMTDEVQRHMQYDCKTVEMFTDVCNVICVINPTMHTVLRELKKDINHYNYKLPVNGDDIMSYFNISPGPVIKSYLNTLINCSFKTPDITKEGCFEILKVLM